MSKTGVTFRTRKKQSTAWLTSRKNEGRLVMRWMPKRQIDTTIGRQIWPILILEDFVPAYGER